MDRAVTAKGDFRKPNIPKPNSVVVLYLMWLLENNLHCILSDRTLLKHIKVK